MSAQIDDIQRDGDALLSEWGRYARRLTDNLGYPRSSTCQAILELHQDKKKKREHKRPVTANGKQKKTRKPVDILSFPDDYMRIDAIVAKAPNNMQKILRRAYLWNQPDRIAARELGWERTQFTELREQAVEWVMKKFTVMY